MPVFEMKSLDAEFEGQSLLAALLYPTRAERTRALTQGRRRAKRGSMKADPATIEVHHPASSDALVPITLSAT